MSSMSFQTKIPNLNSFIEGNRVVPGLKDDFKITLSELETKVSSLSFLIEVMDIKSTLEGMQVKISEEGNETKGLVVKVISIASIHIYVMETVLKRRTKQRSQILGSLSDKVISLEGIDPDKAGRYLSVLLEDDDKFSFADQSMERRQNFSLKALCRNIEELSNEQLPESIEIAEKLIESLKNENSVPELISFCSESPSRTQSLFAIMDYLGLDDLQNEHLEPFNKVFPGIPLDQAPITIRQLDLNHVDVTGFDFSKFTGLKTLNLGYTRGVNC